MGTDEIGWTGTDNSAMSEEAMPLSFLSCMTRFEEQTILQINFGEEWNENQKY